MSPAEEIRAELDQTRAELAEERAAVDDLLTAIREVFTMPPPADLDAYAIRDGVLTQRAIGVSGVLTPPLSVDGRVRLLQYGSMTSVLAGLAADEIPYPVYVEQPAAVTE